MARFKIVGDRGTYAENILWESDSLTEAKRWMDGYLRHNDGGYITVEVLSFDDRRPKIHYEWEADLDDYR